MLWSMTIISRELLLLTVNFHVKDDGNSNDGGECGGGGGDGGGCSGEVVVMVVVMITLMMTQKNKRLVHPHTHSTHPAHIYT